MGKHEELPLFVLWVEFTDWLFDRTEKFPKKVRFTFSSRIDNLTLDILEKIIEACYTRGRSPILKDINLNLDKLRVLLRLCHKREYLSHKSFEHAVKQIHKAGTMCGAWKKKEAE